MSDAFLLSLPEERRVVLDELRRPALLVGRVHNHAHEHVAEVEPLFLANVIVMVFHEFQNLLGVALIHACP